MSGHACRNALGRPLIVLLALAIGLGGVANVSGTALAGEIRVPDDHLTIQDAIDASVNGDTILVAPGEYVEDIRYFGKAITVQSTDGPEMTVLRGTGAGPTVTFKGREGPDSVLEGFTITGGTGFDVGGERYGGGIFCFRASPVIRGNIIEANNAELGFGGGIFCFRGTALIEENEIRDNPPLPDDSRIRAGGGIAALRSALVIRDNDIHDNRVGCENCGIGGGVYLAQDGAPTIIDNRIEANLATCGGGIYTTLAGAVIEDNDVLANEAIECGCILQYGGGIYSGFARVESNRVVDNLAADGGGGIYSTGRCINNVVTGNSCGERGGGIYTAGDVTNCTVLDNTAGQSAGGIRAIGAGQVANSIVRGNDAPVDEQLAADTPPVFSNVEGQGGAGDGMIDEDPKLAVGSRLRLGSPGVDAGTPTAAGLPMRDFEGDDRVLDGDGDGEALPDMGADELLPEMAVRFGAATVPADLLRVNGGIGNSRRRTMPILGTGPIDVSLLAPDGSNGRFVVHLNLGEPKSSTMTVLPFGIGTMGFPLLLADGATPSAVWNNVGREKLVGESTYFGMPELVPERAPTTFLSLPAGDPVNLPVGTTATIQGVILDPSAGNEKLTSITNAVVILIEG